MAPLSAAIRNSSVSFKNLRREPRGPGVVLSLVKELLDCITGDGKPRASTAHANTVTIKATATKRKTHVA
jgi:hypothetical protein